MEVLKNKRQVRRRHWKYDRLTLNAGLGVAVETRFPPTDMEFKFQNLRLGWPPGRVALETRFLQRL
ncbi:hypothetical protein LINGRAHAP2_LOCUS36254 [Linum grandiflorum]